MRAGRSARRRPTGVGVIGCGWVATQRHLPAVRSLADAELVAVADLDTAAARRVGGLYGAVPHESAEALIGDAAVECTAVLVPPAAHAAVVELALAAGKHVLVEKPLGLSAEECDRMVAAATGAGVVATVGHNLRFHRLVRQARRLIEAGAIGAPEAIRTMTIGEGLEAGESVGSWRTDAGAGGGVAIELGVHQYDLWRLLTGREVLRVQAVAAPGGSGGRGAAVSALLVGGVVAEAVSLRARPPANEVTVVGGDGRLDVDLYAFDGLRVRGPREVSGSPRARAAGAAAGAVALPSGLVDLSRGGAYVRSYTEEWRHFLACVRGDEEPEVTFADGREAVRVALGVARSIEAGAAIELRDEARHELARL